VAARDPGAARRWRQALAAARDYDPARVLLPADPRHATFAVVRQAAVGMEGFVVERGVLTGYRRQADETAEAFVAALLADRRPRTTEDDVDVVVRWLGSQGPSAAVVHLPAAGLDAAERLGEAWWRAAAPAGEPR
jgi:hypothetical protein